jgi:hypothetical protein
MKLLRTTCLSAAALLATVTLSAAPVMAGEAAINLANTICSGGDVAGSLAASATTPDEKAVALGEASRQLAAGQCTATQAAIDAALAALVSANPGNPNLQAAYNGQKNAGQKVAGNGIKGFYVDEDEVVGDTLVSTAAGEAVSQP